METREVKRFPASVKWISLALAAYAALAPGARADYVVLQTGQRIHVTGYERVGDSLLLTMAGGTLEIPSDAILRVDPEDTFLSVKVKLLDCPYANFISESARAHGVAPELVASVIAVESNFNPSAVSWRSARGLMQLEHFHKLCSFSETQLYDRVCSYESHTCPHASADSSTL